MVPNVLFSSYYPFDFSFKLLCFPRCFSVHYDCKECLKGYTMKQSSHSSMFSFINKPFLPCCLIFFFCFVFLQHSVYLLFVWNSQENSSFWNIQTLPIWQQQRWVSKITFWPACAWLFAQCCWITAWISRSKDVPIKVADECILYWQSMIEGIYSRIMLTANNNHSVWFYCAIWK